MPHFLGRRCDRRELLRTHLACPQSIQVRKPMQLGAMAEFAPNRTRLDQALSVTLNHERFPRFLPQGIRMRRFLIRLDGSPNDARSLACAVLFCRGLDGRLSVVHTREPTEIIPAVVDGITAVIAPAARPPPQRRAKPSRRCVAACPSPATRSSIRTRIPRSPCRAGCTM